MARGHKRETGNMPTQRALRAGESALLALASTPAFAEVCDKAVGEAWRPSDGPVWLLNTPIGFPLGLVLLLGALVVCFMLKRSAPAFICAGVIAFLFLVSWLFGADEADPIYQAMVREGCTSPSTEKMNAVILAAFGIAYAAVGIFFRMRHVKEA